MNPLPFLRTFILAAVIPLFLALGPAAHATLQEQQAEQGQLLKEIQDLRTQIANKTKVQLDIIDGAMSKKGGEDGSRGIAVMRQRFLDDLEDSIKGLHKTLAQKEGKLQRLEQKMTRTRADLAAKAEKEAEAARQKAEAEKAALAKRDADAKKAMETQKARAAEAAQVAKAKKESSEPGRGPSAPPPANVDNLKTTEKKRAEEAVKAGKARSDALERFAKDPTRENRAAYEAALKNMNSKLAELNKVRAETDKAAGETRPPANAKSVNELIDRLKSEGKISKVQIDSMKEAIKDNQRRIAQDNTRDSISSIARDNVRGNTRSSGTDTAKEANKGMGHSAAQSAGQSAVKPSSYAHPSPRP